MFRCNLDDYIKDYHALTAYPKADTMETILSSIDSDFFMYRNNNVWTGHINVPAKAEWIEYYYEIKHFGSEHFSPGVRVYNFIRK